MNPLPDQRALLVRSAKEKILRRLFDPVPQRSTLALNFPTPRPTSIRVISIRLALPPAQRLGVASRADAKRS